MKTDTRVLLVNLISEDHLARYQAPLAINILSLYVRSKYPHINIITIDMQEVFEEQEHNQGTIRENFLKTIELVVQKIISICSSGRVIVGLSVKWSTQKVAECMIRMVREKIRELQPLFVIGNIGSTHGYKELLLQSTFSNVVAVIGEGEDALVEISRIASQTVSDYRNVFNYKDIPNVAVNVAGEVKIGQLKRIDLKNYPSCTNIMPSDIYDKEWDVHALETSRGCPWGACTFCSIKQQFGIKNSDNRDESSWQWRSFPVQKILDDILYFAKQGVRRFDIKDSDFFGPMRSANDFSTSLLRVENLANGIIAINEELKSIQACNINKTISITHISARVDTIFSANPLEAKRNILRRNIYTLLKAAGLRKVYLGIESGSPSQLKRFGKGVSVEENKRAIEILRELGLEIEVGFIFFDYLTTLDELRQNISFIEETNIQETDSRILGSLRIQKGSPYIAIAKNSEILGREDAGQLSYEAIFLHNNVSEIEKLFSSWEKVTRRLVKVLPSHLRIESYKMDFGFIKNIISCFEAERHDWISTAIEEYSTLRHVFFEKIRQSIDRGLFGKDPPKLFLEYLDNADFQNNKLSSEGGDLCGA